MTAPALSDARRMLALEVESTSALPSRLAQPFTVKRLLEGDPPPPPQLHADNLVLAGDVNLLGGSGDAGKSTTMFTIGVCTVIGRPVFGTCAIRRPGPVVLVVPEDGEAVARHHVDAIIAGMDVSEAERALLIRDMHIVGDTRRFNLLEDTAALRECIAEIEPTLVIADPLSSLLGGAKEDAEEVAEAACANLRRNIARPLGAAVLIAGHLRKPNRDGGGSSVADVYDFKGSVGWSNHARMVWTVSKPKGGDIVTLRLVKSNRLQTGVEHHVKLEIKANPENAAHWFSCRLTDMNLGATSMSQALTPGVGRPLNENERRALAALDDRHEPGARFANSRWLEESGIASKNTFRSVKDRLLEAGLAVAEPTGRMNPNGRTPTYQYGITDRGKGALNSGWALEGVKT